MTLQAGDRLVVAATRRAFSKALAAGNLTIKTLDPSGDSAEQRKIGPDMVMAEAVVAPGSRYAGRTMQFSGLRTSSGSPSSACSARAAWRARRLSEIRLEPGDTLLLCGREAAIAGLKRQPRSLAPGVSAQPIPQSPKARLAVAIFLGIIAGSATGLLPIESSR